MKRFVLHTTKKCNLKCTYCYENNTGKDTKWSEAKELLDIFSKEEKFELEFLGGEPMLNFNLIKQTVEYLDEKECNVRYILTTNGTIFSKDMIDFLEKNKNRFLISVSIDGTKFMNIARVKKASLTTMINSYDIVMGNLKRIAHLEPSIHMVSHPYNVGYLSHGVKHFYDLGFYKIDVGIVESTMKYTNEFINTFIRENNIISDWIINNELPSLNYILLMNKPNNDSKTYIKKDGNTIGEAFQDFETKENVEVHKAKGNSLPKELKEIVYQNHQLNKEGKKEQIKKTVKIGVKNNEASSQIPNLNI